MEIQLYLALSFTIGVIVTRFYCFMIDTEKASANNVTKSNSDFSKVKELINKVHFYVARDNNGKLWLYLGKPIRMKEQFVACSHGNNLSKHVSKYGLKENDYNNLKWEDEPVEVFLNLED